MFDHNIINDIMKEIKRNNAVILSHEYNLKHQLKFTIDLDNAKHLIEKLKIFKEVDVTYIKTIYIFYFFVPAAKPHSKYGIIPKSY